MKLRLNASSVVVGLAIGALAAGGITYAAANTGGTTINACQSKSTGALRVLVSGVCKSTESAVVWNTQGPQGDQGEQGPQGVQGERGPAVYEDSSEAATAAADVPGLWATYPQGRGWDRAYSGWRAYSVPANQRVLVHRLITTQSGLWVEAKLQQGACSPAPWNDPTGGYLSLPSGVQDVDLGTTGEDGGCAVVSFPTEVYRSALALRLFFLPSK